MFLLLLVLFVNFKKAILLSQHALGGCSQPGVINSILSKGVSLLGASSYIDSIVCSLVISVGTLWGVWRSETSLIFTSVTFAVNFVVMMISYPAYLSLVLDVSCIFAGRITLNHAYVFTTILLCLIDSYSLEETKTVRRFGTIDLRTVIELVQSHESR